MAPQEMPVFRTHRFLNKSDLQSLSVVSWGHFNTHLERVLPLQRITRWMPRLDLTPRDACAETLCTHPVSWSPVVLFDRHMQVPVLLVNYRIQKKAPHVHKITNRKQLLLPVHTLAVSKLPLP